MTTFTGKLLPTQYKFVNDFSHREVAYVGGYGAGKSQSAACKAIKLAAMNKNYSGAILSPTYGMLVDTLIPTFEDTLNVMGVRYTYKASPAPVFIIQWKGGNSKVYCRSAENYRRLASLNLAWAIVDECDLLDKANGKLMWKMLQSRLRTGNYRQLCATSTPEGYNLLYDLFVKENKEFKSRYHAKTTENYHLPQDYIDNLYSSYSPAEIEAYINGEFTNLKSGTVYNGFDRTESHTNLTIDDFATDTRLPVLHIGVDFNVHKTCGIVCVKQKENIYIVDEFTGLRDTEELINAINRRYPQHTIMVYPDSSGKSGQTATTLTDIALLKGAFGQRNVRYPSRNPKIMNRVKAVNAMLLNGNGVRRLYVNTTECNEITTCLEQQAFDPKTGLPDKKSDLDHPLDALGYFIHHTSPIISRPSARNI